MSKPLAPVIVLATMSDDQGGKKLTEKAERPEEKEKPEEEPLEGVSLSSIEKAEQSEEEPQEGLSLSSLENAEQPQERPVCAERDLNDAELVERFERLLSLYNKVTIMVAGKPRMGKSTVLNNLLGLTLATGPGADSVTTAVVDETAMYENVQIRYIDTPGLQALDEESEEVLHSMKLKIGQGDDSFTLLYCISVYSSFTEDDVKIIKNLNAHFGVDIWKRCILVLTRCDTERRESFSTEDLDRDYLEYLDPYATQFKKALEKCSSDVPPVKLIFNCQDDSTTGNIVAVPVAKSIEFGREPNIFPGLKVDGSLNWSHYLFMEVLKKAGNFSVSVFWNRYNACREFVRDNRGALATIGTAVTGLGVVIAARRF